MKNLLSFIDYFDLCLNEHVWNAEVIYQEIKLQGYDCFRSTLHQYIHPKRVLRPLKQAVRFEMHPDQRLQHCWGETETMIA
ncbi:hypothetical protein FOT81_03715 [Raoultella planticola]|nr:hypothetical protein [Raoultella planticola]